MELHQWLQKRDPENYKRVMNILSVVEPILKSPLHRNYTDHSITHSERVIVKLGGLSHALMSSESLSWTEAYVLMAAAYMHDLRMQDELSGRDDLRCIRDGHHELSPEWVSQLFGEADVAMDRFFRDAEILDLVCRVAQAHRSVVDLSDAMYNSEPYGEEFLRPRLLGALLRFADELDTDHHRAPPEMLPLRVVPPDSLYHWYKCHYVKAVNIKDEYVVVWFRFPEGCAHYGHFIIPFVNGKIQDTFDQLQGIFREHGVKLGLGQPKTKEIPGLRPMPPEVEAFAREQCIRRYEEVKDETVKGLSFVRSLSVELLGVADG